MKKRLALRLLDPLQDAFFTVFILQYFSHFEWNILFATLGLMVKTLPPKRKPTEKAVQQFLAQN